MKSSAIIIFLGYVLAITACKEGEAPITSPTEDKSKLTALSNSASGHYDYWRDSIGRSPKSVSEAEERAEMIRKIGEEQILDAVPSLLDHLVEIPANSLGVFSNTLDYRNNYPCSYALEKIGEPAVSEIRSRFLDAESFLEQAVLFDTLARIDPNSTESWVSEIQQHSSMSDETLEKFQKLAKARRKRAGQD